MVLWYRQNTITLLKFSGEAREWLSFVTTYRRTTDYCQFTESENTERLRKSEQDNVSKW
jgi:hypothetical protein